MCWWVLLIVSAVIWGIGDGMRDSQRNRQK